MAQEEIPVPPALASVEPAQPSPALPALQQTLRETVEHYLRRHGVPFVNVDEAKKALFHGARLRSFHFVVYHPTGGNWLVWAAQLRKEVREDLQEWEKIFGDGFIAVVAKQTSSGTPKFQTLAGEAVDIQ
ncbi:MAG: hypothetical protein WCI73_00340 [Phycisphaerae bacterium]